MLSCAVPVVDSLLFKPPESSPYEFPDWIRLRTVHDNVIYATLLKRKAARITILYSHGNADDLNSCYGFLRRLSRKLNVNVISYDYSGYGVSSGKPSEENCYADIDAVYDYLLRWLRLDPQQIVVYGRSLGSGPSCYLASKSALEGRPVAGLVLVSPFCSVYRVVVDLGVTLSGDKFPNIDRMSTMKCKVMIVHGDRDEVIPFKHSVALHKALPELCRTKPFWVKGMKHNTESDDMEARLFRRIRTFLELHVTSQLIKMEQQSLRSYC